MRRFFPHLGLFLLMMSCSATALVGAEYSQLWGADGSAWSPTSLLPDVSQAGFSRGQKPIPDVPVVATVTSFGAVGDGVQDDTKAFQAALAQAPAGAILVPPGRYLISDVLIINRPNVVLRGSGPAQTTLWFPKSLSAVKPAKGKTTTGLVTTSYSFGHGFLTIRGSIPVEHVKSLTAPVARGEDRLTVESTEGFAVGDVVEIRGVDDPKMHLIQHLYQQQAGSISKLADQFVAVTARIMALNGNQVRIDRAFPCDLDLRFKPRIGHPRPSVNGSGIEGFRLEFPDVPYPGHFKEPGFNGVELATVSDCWVRNLVIHNADSGIFVDEGSRFCTVDGIRITASATRVTEGASGHHGIEIKLSDDNLVTDFHVECRFIHDLTVERAARNVFERGTAVDLCIDGHKYTPWANVFTDLDAGAGTRLWEHGGGADLGGAHAAWTTFWNISAAKPQRDPPRDYGPDIMNFVGVGPGGGKPTGTRWWETMDPRVLIPSNIYRAQVDKLRHH